MFELPFQLPVTPAEPFGKKVAYFSMEFALDQALKTYSGGLGFLAGSHMRSAWELRQNLVGIGVLWKYGYYDQERSENNAMQATFREKIYHFLQDTEIRFQLPLLGRNVWVHVYYLAPEVFGTAPMFFLTSDTEGNDYAGRSISYHLYDSDATVKVAQCALLGLGGGMLLDKIGWEPEVYHLNEAHALPVAFHLYAKLGSLEKLKQKLIFTTHTPEEAGNEKHNIHFLKSIGFFSTLQLEEVRKITGFQDDTFNHTLAGLRMSRIANGVSKLHGQVSREMWSGYADICEITHITNAQNKEYWVDKELETSRIHNDGVAVAARKKVLKRQLFKEVADQTGRLFSPEVVTIVWARRFAAYKRADLLLGDFDRFVAMLHNEKYPVQLIWAGKPYPKDGGAIDLFNHLQNLSHLFGNIAVLTGYELGLSKLLKDGADVWLNTPVVTREASGTSGMTAAMNGAINCSTYDGWIPEFARDKENSFILPVVKEGDIDQQDRSNLFDLLENEILPMYYNQPEKWQGIALTGMSDVSEAFGSHRMAKEYYEKIYSQG
jgi:starch phosphorylase